MSDTDRTKTDGNPDLADQATATQHGVPAGAAQEDSPGGYGGTDRLQSEAGPLQQGAGNDQAAGKDKAKDI